MDPLYNARRKNQAYEEVYGPANLLNAPITRDLAANRVIERRSAFPAIETRDYFTGEKYNTLHYNMKMTGGLNLKDRESFRTKTQPGQLSAAVTYGPESDSSSGTNIWMYAVGIILLIVIIMMVF